MSWWHWVFGIFIAIGLWIGWNVVILRDYSASLDPIYWFMDMIR